MNRRDVVAERLDRRQHALMLGDMVGAENVDHAVEAAPQLLDMIGDVGRAIGRLASRPRAHQHAILGQPQRLAAQPHRAVVVGDKAALAQALDHRVDLAAADQIEFVGVDVEADAQALAGAADVGKDRLLGWRAKDFRARPLGERLPWRATSLRAISRMYSPW